MLKVLELFGGIGACTKALKRLKMDYEVVDYVEIDKYAVASYNAINGTNFKPQDISKWDKDIEVDLIMHGSPCQDFSKAGKNLGGDKGSGTRSSLMYETIRIVSKLKPKYVIWENVKNVISKTHIHNFSEYLNVLKELGYTNYYQVLNSNDYGIPQSRKRIFVISILGLHKPFHFPHKQKLNIHLENLLEDHVDKKYYLTTKESNDLKFKEDDIDHLNLKNATKRGYIEGYYGDSVDLSYPNSKSKRGRVGHHISQTLTTKDLMGVVVYDKERTGTE